MIQPDIEVAPPGAIIVTWDIVEALTEHDYGRHAMIAALAKRTAKVGYLPPVGSFFTWTAGSHGPIFYGPLTGGLRQECLALKEQWAVMVFQEVEVQRIERQLSRPRPTDLPSGHPPFDMLQGDR